MARALAGSAVCAQFQILSVLRQARTISVSGNWRLTFEITDGEINEVAVLFDNERGKGDHRHIGEVEDAYRFETAEKLIEDFKAAVHKAREAGG